MCTQKARMKGEERPGGGAGCALVLELSMQMQLGIRPCDTAESRTHLYTSKVEA